MEYGRVLVAPLNWGLGHAVRCLPIIQFLLDKGCEVILASDGDAGRLLQKEYPDLIYHELPSYQVRYPDGDPVAYWLQRLPALYQSIKREHRYTRHLVQRHQLDAIISDNRYGVYDHNARSVFMTHQLSLDFAWLRKVSRFFLRRLIMRFDQCWIPDDPPPENLTGRLSRGDLGIPKYFLGPISDMQRQKRPLQYEFLVLLSGPEPHRSYLQARLEGFFENRSNSVAWVLGKSGAALEAGTTGPFWALCNRAKVNELLCSSKIVISRSGYTSLMDYYQLNKKAVLIPTPGQPEQNYLAKLHEHRFSVVNQSLSDLSNVLAEIAHQGARPPRNQTRHFQAHLEAWLEGQ